MQNASHTGSCVHWLSCSEVLRAAVTFVRWAWSSCLGHMAWPVNLTSSTFRSISVNECMERMDLERWTKPEHTSAAILIDQSNAEHRTVTHFTCRNKLSGNGMICTAALVLSELAKGVLQQQTLSPPSNHLANYSLVIHTRQAKWRYIIRSRHTGLRSPTLVRNMQSVHRRQAARWWNYRGTLKCSYACKSNVVFPVFQAKAPAQSLHWLPVTVRMKLSSTHQLKKRPQPVIKQHLLGWSPTYKKQTLEKAN